MSGAAAERAARGERNLAEAAAAAVDWKAAAEEAVELLRGYLRIPTVNDPQSLDPGDARDRPWRGGREAEAAEFLRAALAEDRIDAELLESAPGRVNVIARSPGGPGQTLTLLSHSDVVPALRHEWSGGIDPFGGEVRDGYLYGRGALDLKGLGITHLMVLKLLGRLSPAPRREIRLLVLADEEAGGRYGAQWLLASRPDLLATGLVLGEGAYSTQGLLPCPGPLHAIAVGEKGYLELELIANRASHHASMPDRDNASANLVHALARILAVHRPLHITPLTRSLLRRLAQAGGIPAIFARMPGLMARLAPRHFSRSIILDSLLRDTIVVTALAAGQKNNVVPSLARAVLSIRLLPTTDPEDLTGRLRKLVQGLGIEVRSLMYKPSNASPFDTPAFQLLGRHAVAGSERGLVAPIVSPAASDCRFWRLSGVTSYGWVPFVIAGDDLHGVHGSDERISLSAFAAGLRNYFRAVVELTSLPISGTAAAPHAMKL